MNLDNNDRKGLIPTRTVSLVPEGMLKVIPNEYELLVL